MSKVEVFKIDTDVPVPKNAQTVAVRDLVPVEQLEVGQSILFPLKLRGNVATIASRLQRDGSKYTVKKVSDHDARIWRVK